MIRKLTHVVMALFLGVLTCSIQEQFRCETPGTIPPGAGIIQPLTASPQDDPTEPDPRQQLNIDEHIQGTRSVPAGGIGLMQTWGF
jgi:hypothetical protein